MGCSQRNSGFGQKRRITAEDRRRQRSAAAPRQRKRLCFVAIGNNRRHRPKNLNLVNNVGIAAVARIQAA